MVTLKSLGYWKRQCFLVQMNGHLSIMKDMKSSLNHKSVQETTLLIALIANGHLKSLLVVASFEVLESELQDFEGKGIFTLAEYLKSQKNLITRTFTATFVWQKNLLWQLHVCLVVILSVVDVKHVGCRNVDEEHVPSVDNPMKHLSIHSRHNFSQLL